MSVNISSLLLFFEEGKRILAYNFPIFLFARIIRVRFNIDTRAVPNAII